METVSGMHRMQMGESGNSISVSRIRFVSCLIKHHLYFWPLILPLRKEKIIFARCFSEFFFRDSMTPFAVFLVCLKVFSGFHCGFVYFLSAC